MSGYDIQRPLVERLFAPIESREEARTIAADVGKILVLLGVLQAVVALLRGRPALVDAAGYAVLGVLVWATASRLAAIATLLAVAGAAWLTIQGMLAHPPQATGRHVLIVLPAIWLAARAFQATWLVHRAPTPDEPPAESDVDAPGR